jgi:hypothetical protein
VPLPALLRPPVQALFAAAATPLVVATALGVARRHRRLALGPLLVELRARGRRPLPRALARPEWLAGTVERLLPLLPPRALGPCLRRSLILLELWSRCGLEPRLHLGFRLESPERDGHAWLSATGADGADLRVSGPHGTRPAFEL